MALNRMLTKITWQNRSKHWSIKTADKCRHTNIVRLHCKRRCKSVQFFPELLVQPDTFLERSSFLSNMLAFSFLIGSGSQSLAASWSTGCSLFVYSIQCHEVAHKLDELSTIDGQRTESLEKRIADFQNFICVNWTKRNLVSGKRLRFWRSSFATSSQSWS